MMKERRWFYFGLELLLGAACLFAGYGGVDFVALFVCGLVLACLITAKLLVQLLKAPQAFAWLAAASVLVVLFLFNSAVLLPLFAVLLIEAIEQQAGRSQTIAVVAVASALLALVLEQLPLSLVLAAMGIVLAIWVSAILQQLELAQKILVQKDASVATLEAQLVSQRKTISAIEQQGRQAERSRIAARIHDKVGHGISGSIITLEAALINLDGDPAKARHDIELATQNLRTSVDGIRSDLREERGQAPVAGLPQIASELERFEAEHSGKHSELDVRGALELIPQTVWVCLYQNLRETLTNMLKHSSADKIKVSVEYRNGLVTARFEDNGGCVGDGSGEDREASIVGAASHRSPLGMGLRNIEERCILCGGKAFFSQTDSGFCTVMTFTQHGNLQIRSTDD
jgi:signal transduction histidine kinase